MNKELLFSKLSKILKDAEILMRELEEERNEALADLKFEGEEEILIKYYKKVLISIYRMRNNAAALLLRNSCTCLESDENLGIMVNGVICNVPKQALKNILQKEYDSILKKNITETIMDVAIIHSETELSVTQPVKSLEVKKDAKQAKEKQADKIVNLNSNKTKLSRFNPVQKKITEPKEEKHNKKNISKAEEINLFEDSLFDQSFFDNEIQFSDPIETPLNVDIPDSRLEFEPEPASRPVSKIEETLYLPVVVLPPAALRCRECLNMQGGRHRLWGAHGRERRHCD